MNNRAWTMRRRLVACWVGTALLWAGYIGLALEPYNRFNMFFDGWDTTALILLVTGCGLVAALLLHLAAKCSAGRSDWLLSPWFFFWLVLVAFNFRPAFRLSLVGTCPWLSGTVYYLLIWTIGLVLTGCGYLSTRMRRVASAGWRVSFYLWPLLPLLLVNLGMAHRWENVGETPTDLGRRTDGVGAPVVIVVLDMIGYEDAFAEGGRVKDELPRLADFAATATVYHHARSPGDETGRSLPGLLLQEEVDLVELGRGPARWTPADSPGAFASPAEEFEGALPYAFRQAGYRSMLIGYYLPYTEIMPGAFDEVFTRSYYGAALGSSEGSALGNACLHQWLRLMEASKDPLSAAAKQFGLTDKLFRQYYRNLNAAVDTEGLQYIRKSFSIGDFVVLHLPVPHQPFAFDAVGGSSPFRNLDPAGYPGQLRYADRLFGEWMKAIQKTGLWEKSWVLMLSDHGPHFRDYSGTVDGKRHVPFMVKAPGQRDRRDVDAPIRLVDLKLIPGFPLSQTPFPSDAEGDAVEE